MSGYIRIPAGEWMREHFRAAWTLENPAPGWWIAADVAWLADQRALPSARAAAALWGVSKNRAATLIRQYVEQQAEWEARTDRKKAILAILIEWAAKEPKSATATRLGTGRSKSDFKHEYATGTGDQPETPVIEESAGQNRDTTGTAAGQNRDTSRERSLRQPQPQPQIRENPKAPAPPPAQAPAPEPDPEPPADAGSATHPDPGPDPAMPRWVPKAKDCAPATRRGLLQMVVRCVEATRGTLPNPDRCGTDAPPLIGLWKRLGRPDPATFVEEFRLVAEWALGSPDPLAARDIRAEGWPDGTDRSRAVATLARQDRWGDRLAAAQAWHSRGRPPPAGSATPAAQAGPAGHQDAEAADAFERVRSVAASTTSRAAVLERLTPMELELLHQVGGRAAVVKEPWQLRDTRARFIELYNRHPERVAT